MTSDTLNRVHGLSVWRAVFKGNGRWSTVQVPLKFGGIVRSPVMVDCEHRVAIRAYNGELGAKEGANKPAIIGEDAHELST